MLQGLVRPVAFTLRKAFTCWGWTCITRRAASLPGALYTIRYRRNETYMIGRLGNHSPLTIPEPKGRPGCSTENIEKGSRVTKTGRVGTVRNILASGRATVEWDDAATGDANHSGSKRAHVLLKNLRLAPAGK